MLHSFKIYLLAILVVWVIFFVFLISNFNLWNVQDDIQVFNDLLKITDDLEKSQKKTNQEFQNILHKLSNKYDRTGDYHDQLGEEYPDLVGVEVERGAKDASDQGVSDFELPVLVIACNRPYAVNRSLANLVRYRPSERKFPIIVSQDCGHQPTADAIMRFSDQVTLIKHPNLSKIPVKPGEKKFAGYFYLARHYKWALNNVFDRGFQGVIVIEDDLDVSADIFSYFEATWPILKADPTLFCVSAWNDNGKRHLIDLEGGEVTLHRTDFFPGLGWMMTRDLWRELGPKWPVAYWDDWVRQPAQRRGRSCIRPEVPRTRTFGKIGVSNGQFFEKHLKKIYLNEKPVDFSTHSLQYLMKEEYDKGFRERLRKMPEATVAEVRTGRYLSGDPPGEVKIRFGGAKEFKAAAKVFGLMDDFKEGVPRTAYAGVVPFVYRGRRVFLVPGDDWNGYDPSWR